MKTIKYILLLIILNGFFACDDFLEEQAKSLVSTDNYYNTLKEATTALNGSYDMLQPIYNSLGINFISEIASDVFTNGGGAGGSQALTMDDYSFDASSGIFSDLYAQHYNLINSVNTLIYQLEQREYPNENLKNAIIGEASFLRALAYFNLVRMFGDVPFRIEPSLSTTGLDIERTAASDIYEHIIKDLQFAINNLSEASISAGRTNKIAAYSLLGKVQLTLGNYAETKSILDNVIGKRDLYPDFADVFKVANENNTIESIFEVQYGIRPENSSILQYINSEKLGGHGWIYGVYAVDTKVVNAFTQNDVRKDISLWDKNKGVAFGQWFVKKFNDALLPGVDVSDAGMINFPLIRYADVLLMQAEAINNTNNGPNAEAYAMVNKVRNRAGLDDLPDGLGKSEFLNAILEERFKEFVAEGKRYFDLQRLGLLADVLQNYGFVAGKHDLWPIPQAAIDANANLTQNPGY